MGEDTRCFHSTLKTAKAVHRRGVVCHNAHVKILREIGTDASTWELPGEVVWCASSSWGGATAVEIMPALVCPVVRPEDVALGVGPRRQLAVPERLHDVDLASDGPAARGGVTCMHEHH
jgi:hypothetical protein